jgi:hypothetical protein
LRAAFSALRRSRIAFRASPGFETFARLKLGAGFGAADLVPLERPPFLK